MKVYMPLPLKNSVIKRDNFTCQKCGFEDISSKDLEIHHIKPIFEGGTDHIDNLIVLCSICHRYAPDSEIDFKIYISEKLEKGILDTFRKSNYSISKRTKFGMQRKAKEGGFITKAPKGYKLQDKQLIIHEQEAQQVREIFKEFLETDTSLTRLAKKHDMTTSGMKKLLQNTTYLGKVKFAKEESLGQHDAILDKELFNNVKNKLK